MAYVSNVQMSWESPPEGFVSSARTPPPILKDKPLFKEFSTTGQFWRPSEPSRSLWGSLKFTPGDGVHLLLDGNLLDESAAYGEADFDILHGRISNGSPCTLFACTSYGTTYFGGEPRFQSHVWADYLVGGGLFDSLESCKFKAMYVRFSHLDDWFNSPYKIRHKRGGFRKSLISFSPDHFEVPLDYSGQGFKLKTFCGRTIPTHAPREGACWKYFYKLYLEPDCGQSLKWYLDAISHLRSCFTFLVGSGVYTLELEGELPQAQVEGPVAEEEGPPQMATIYLAVDVPSVVQVDPFHFSTHYRSLENSIAGLLGKWFERRDELLVVTRAYSEVLVNDGSYEESIFLRIVQVLEHFHGILFSEEAKYFSKASWNIFLSWLREQFPEQLRNDTQIKPEKFPELKEIIVQRIAPLNKISFRSRLDQLFRGIPGSELMPIMRNPPKLEEEVSRFLRSVEATRNYLTHHSEEQAKDALSGESLQEAVFRCWAVLTFWLAKSLGVNDNISGDIALAAKKAMFLVSRRSGL